MAHSLTPSPGHRALAGLLRRPRGVLAVAVAVALVGVWATWQAPLGWLPRVELPEVIVEAAWADAAPRTVEARVTAPIERVVQEVPGLGSIESMSRPGYALVRATIRAEADPAVVAAEVREQVQRLRAVLPEGVHPTTRRALPAALAGPQAFLTIQVRGPDLSVLRRYAESEIVPALARLDGLASVSVEGGTRESVVVELIPERLRALGVAPEAVVAALHEGSVMRPVGRTEEATRSVPLLWTAAGSLDGLATLPVVARSGTVHPLGRLARLTREPEPPVALRRVDGESVVAVTLVRAPGSNVLSVAGNVRRALPTLPAAPGVSVAVAEDTTREVRLALRDLAWRGALGLALVALVLVLGLRSVRAAAAVLGVAGVTMAATLAALPLVGLELNVLTLAGLVLLFGLLVDNALVVVEDLASRSGSAVERAAATLATVWPPLLGGTLTTVAALVPLLYLSGELRAAFVPLGLVCALGLGLSLVAALTLAPTLARPVGGTASPDRNRPRTARRTARRWFLRPYALAARWPRATLLGLVLFVGLPLSLLPTALPDAPAPVARAYGAALGESPWRTRAEAALGGVTRPFLDALRREPPFAFVSRPEVTVRATLPSGGNLAQADSVARLFEAVALSLPGVERVLTDVGPRQATVRVLLTAADDRNAFNARDRLDHRAARLAGLDLTVTGVQPLAYSSRGGGGVAGFVVEALGPHYDSLGVLLGRLAADLAREPRVRTLDASVGRFAERPEAVIRLRPDADGLARHGLDARTLADGLAPVLAPATPRVRLALDGAADLPVHVRIPGAEHVDEYALTRWPVHGRPAGALIHVERTTSAPTIERVSQVYRRHLLVEYLGPPEFGRARIEEALARTPAPPGYRAELPDLRALFFQTDEPPSLWLLVGAVLALLLITAFVYDSWRLAGVTVLSLPAAAAGIALAFTTTGTTFTEGTWIGLVLLIGLAANDSLLLGYRYRRLRLASPRTPARRAGLVALRHRIGPMGLTTLTTVAGLAPLLGAASEGAFWPGFALTVLGGLLASTALVPAAMLALWSLPQGNENP